MILTEFLMRLGWKVLGDEIRFISLSDNPRLTQGWMWERLESHPLFSLEEKKRHVVLAEALLQSTNLNEHEVWSAPSPGPRSSSPKVKFGRPNFW